jgi:hypothetical protein
MKRISIPLLAVAIALLNSCQKSDEYLSAESAKAKYFKGGYLQNKPNAEVKGCQIVQINYSLGSSNDVLQFTYNSLGDPVSITRVAGGHTGYPNYSFKYDEKNRLTDFIGPYSGNTTAEYWHKYFYDAPGNIILDSAYIFPKIAYGFPENAYMRQLTYYTYDSKGRIIKDSTVFSGISSATVHTYAYDANGNKTGNMYDDKININRTNKIWMFLNKDYSVNNPFTADSYTSSGLPSSFNLPAAGNILLFLNDVYPEAQITYNCSAK